MNAFLLSNASYGEQGRRSNSQTEIFAECINHAAGVVAFWSSTLEISMLSAWLRSLFLCSRMTLTLWAALKSNYPSSNDVQICRILITTNAKIFRSLLSCWLIADFGTCPHARLCAGSFSFVFTTACKSAIELSAVDKGLDDEAKPPVRGSVFIHTWTACHFSWNLVSVVALVFHLLLIFIRLGWK